MAGAARDSIIAAWIQKRPGTRPRAWWELDAPNEPVVTHRAGDHEAAHRRRLGGIGIPKHEVLGYVPYYSFGVPTQWINRWEVKLYSGKVRGMDGKPLLKKRKGVVAPDPTNPPVFESEASFLRRHNLLLPGEEKRLSRGDFEPEVLEVDVVGEGVNPYAPRPGKTGIPV